MTIVHIVEQTFDSERTFEQTFESGFRFFLLLMILFMFLFDSAAGHAVFCFSSICVYFFFLNYVV